MPLIELADLVANLPAGCALWRATGGPMAWSLEMHMLVRIEFGVRQHAWLDSKDGQDGKNRPTPIEPPKSVHEKRVEDAALSRRAQAYKRRTGQA